MVAAPLSKSERESGTRVLPVEQPINCSQLRGFFNIRLEDADAHALLALGRSWPRVNRNVDLSLRGQGSREWYGNGA